MESPGVTRRRSDGPGNAGMRTIDLSFLSSANASFSLLPAVSTHLLPRSQVLIDCLVSPCGSSA